MTVILVEHATELPALDGMAAALVAAERGGVVLSLVGGGAGFDRFDCVQHVLAHGELAPGGLVWAERATARTQGPPVDRGAVADHSAATVVVGINPLLRAHREAAERILVGTRRAGRALERLRVEPAGGGFAIVGDGYRREVRIDLFGRPSGEHPSPTQEGPATRLLLVGDEAFLREVYPGVLAALGDAAAESRTAVGVAFVDPRETADGEWPDRLAGIDGLLLPGGSDMEQVAGQIAAARVSLDAEVPTLGLCLGMQTMCTAVAQVRAGLAGAGMAEATPDAPIKTFVRLHDEQGRPMHRLGELEMRVVRNSRLGAILGARSVRVRYNHRYVLDPALHEILADAGLSVTGLHADRDFADAVELAGHPFFIGLQGHPELCSRQGRPFPVFAAFLAAAAEHSDARAPRVGAPAI